jgi:hypothetical protein
MHSDPRNHSRGDRAIRWIEKYCVTPDTPDGEQRPVRLSLVECLQIRKLYNLHHVPDEPISGPLASYIALLHICGPEALGEEPPPPVQVDSWTVWRAAANPDLRRVLEREREAIVCPKLGTRYPTRAA